MAWRMDAFVFHWGGLRLYAFPPLILLSRVLRKIREDRARVLLIAPHWPKRAWFLDLVSLLVDLPRRLPSGIDLVLDPRSGLPSPLPESLYLTAWPLSGETSARQDFLSGLLASSAVAAGPRPGIVTTLAWQATVSGAMHGVLVPVLHLSHQI